MPSPVFTKLQLKDQKRIHVLDAPESFEKELRALKGVQVLRAVGQEPVEFAIAFVTKQADFERHAKALVKKSVEGDVVLWIAYPKGTSRRYKSELSRDSGWQVLGDLGFEGVRLVAIDEDWSALRFRRAAFIKSLKRDAKRAMSSEGKGRSRQSK
jgi:hypothetical protein